jgi:predicted O-linked N-acetylglucosamine transferase (SPINDLY family)
MIPSPPASAPTRSTSSSISAGQTKGSRPGVLARRPAPLQGTFIGDAKTTGTPGIDFKLIDAITDPPGAEAAYTEKLIRLPECFLCYRPHDEMPEPQMPPGPGVTFASFNVSEKVGPAVVALWSRVLAAVPDSTLLLKATAFGYELTRRIYRDRFASHGIDPARIRFAPHTLYVRDHFAQYHGVDIALDPFPYNGTTTNCDALWMGVPIITLRGSLHAGRVGASLLSAVGLSDLVADDHERFIETARTLAADRPRRTQLRSSLRAAAAASALGDGPRYAAKLESTVRSLWREHILK